MENNDQMRRKFILPMRFGGYEIVHEIYCPDNAAYAIDDEGNVYHFKLTGMNVSGPRD